MTEGEAGTVVRKWMRKVMDAANIKVVEWRDGSTGLLDVPAKYVAVIDVMTSAIFLALVGRDLPEIVKPAPAKKKRRTV